MSRSSNFKPTNISVKGRERSHQQIELELRQKNEELQLEVKTLKQKLDELRKAKSTTLIKREKEFVSKLTIRMVKKRGNNDGVVYLVVLSSHTALICQQISNTGQEKMFQM